MPTKKPPKYCGPHKHSGKGYVWHNGRQIYFKGKHGTSESLRGYRDYLLSLEGKVLEPVPDDTTLSVMANAWLDHHEEIISYKNLSHYKSCLRVLCDMGLASTLTKDFGPKKLKEFRSELVRRGYARSTVNQHVGRIKKMFRWGVSEEMVPPHVSQALYAVAGLRSGESCAPDPKRRRPATWERVQEITPFLSGVVVDMARLHWLTGMRSDNLCMLSMDQIDTSGDVWFYTPERHKTQWKGKGLRIPIGPEGQEIISRQAAGRKVFSPAASIAWHIENNPQYLKWSSRTPGDKYTPNTYRQAILRAQARAAGIPVKRKLPTRGDFERAGWDFWTPYDLRNAAVTRLRQKYSIEQVRAYMGHSTVQATEIYSEHDARTAAEIAKSEG